MERLLFDIENLRCSYEQPFIEGTSRVVLEIRQLQIERGKKVFIVGESGIGKSTILETLGMMNNTIVPDPSMRFLFYEADGSRIDLYALWHSSDRTLSRFRLHNYSFIFQSNNLMRNFTAYENVAYTRMLQGYSQKECFQRARQVLHDLNLEHIDEQRLTQELSGGQQQRLAFARAILPDFTVLFGDEPTGNLDPENAAKVMRIIRDELSGRQDASAIVVSHDMHLATTFADIIVKIRKGVLHKPSPCPPDTPSANTLPLHQHHGDDEYVTYGIIDETSIFRPDEKRAQWHNGVEYFATADFENYLRKK